MRHHLAINSNLTRVGGIRLKITLIAFIASATVLTTVPAAHAQMPAQSEVDWNEVVEHTAREEQEGKALWDKFRAEEVTCERLSGEQFAVLGEFFMGQMAGESHAAMNAMMIQVHGKAGAEQIHLVVGKRLSGCDTAAAFPANSSGWMPMMSMMFPLRQGAGGQEGGWSFDGAQDRSSPLGSNNLTSPEGEQVPYGAGNMMNFGFGPFGGFGWIFMILWWVLIIAGIVALTKWLTSQSRGSRDHEKSALEILEERYARGEIDKQEFAEKKRDLR